MGVVYEAVQGSLGRHVAVKVLTGNSLLNSTQLERFRREARAAARLHHTNIVPVFGVGEDAGTHYYAMQYIQGQGLDSVLRELVKLRRTGSVPEPDPGQESLAASVARGLLTDHFRVASRAADQEKPPEVRDEPVPAGAQRKPAGEDRTDQLQNPSSRILRRPPVFIGSGRRSRRLSIFAA
jgi:hypothetical protein